MRFIWNSKMIPVFILLISAQSIQAQQVKNNPYGLPIISSIVIYDSIKSVDSLKKLVDLGKVIPGIQLDIRYATSNNFTHKKIYTLPRAYARLSVAKALSGVVTDLNSHGLGLKIYDAYRPYAATLLFYETVKDTVFVAAP